MKEKTNWRYTKQSISFKNRIGFLFYRWSLYMVVLLDSIIGILTFGTWSPRLAYWYRDKRWYWHWEIDNYRNKVHKTKGG